MHLGGMQKDLAGHISMTCEIGGELKCVLSGSDWHVWEVLYCASALQYGHQ